jgi:hypothetical protein
LPGGKKGVTGAPKIVKKKKDKTCPFGKERKKDERTENPKEVHATFHTYLKGAEGDTGRGRGVVLEDNEHHVIPCDVGKTFG